MSLSYYDLRRKPRTILARLWIVTNAVIAFGMLFYWSGLVGVVGEPYKWAMQSTMTSQPALFDTNYVVLWATPILCMISGWVALRARQDQVARIVGCYPSMFLAVMLGWYNLAPQHWL